MVKAGSWVEIEQVILEPGARAEKIPEDTKSTPLLMRVSGFLLDEAEIGKKAAVRTLIGRRLEGTLMTVGPHYSHSFGNTVDELLLIGTEADNE